MPQRSAFTLIELSIVLVIIGLLVGGVLAGRAVIQAAELRSILTERYNFATAIDTFKNTYAALPGDMANAYAVFGDACGTNSMDTATGCNGNGNRHINLSPGENMKAWEHLARAGFISGSFDGNGTGSIYGGGLQNLADTSVPAARFKGAYWNMLDATEVGMAGTTKLGVSLQLGALNTSPLVTELPRLTLGDAQNLDTKSDDGMANEGTMRGYDNSVARCYDNGTDTYHIQTLGEKHAGECILSFLLE